MKEKYTMCSKLKEEVHTLLECVLYNNLKNKFVKKMVLRL